MSEEAIKCIGVAGMYCYASISASGIRHFVDNTFPYFAKNAVADVASGQGHRWRAGHDLLVDVLPRMTQNPGEALHQAGHILLTDFPTKAGIPIPGFSESGLGKLLVEMGIPKGYLSLNVVDGVAGIYAIGEGYGDMVSAIQGGTLDGWTFFDTYGEGVVELCLGVQTQNPLMIAGGAENLAAGVIHTANTIDEMIVTVEEFFGASLGASLIGMGISLFLSRHLPPPERAKYIAMNGARAALLGGASSISPLLACGLVCGILAYELGKALMSPCPQLPGYKLGAARVTLQALCDESSVFKQCWDVYEKNVKASLEYYRKIDAPFTVQLKELREWEQVEYARFVPEFDSSSEDNKKAYYEAVENARIADFQHYNLPTYPRGRGL